MKCKGCGLEDCNTKPIHESVVSQVQDMTQVEQLQVMRRHGIEPPNGYLNPTFAKQIVSALLELEAQVNGLPENTRPYAEFPQPEEEAVDVTFFDTYPAMPYKR